MPGAPSGRDGQHGDLRHPGVRGRALGELLVGRVGARGGVGPRQRQLGGPQEAPDMSVRASRGGQLAGDVFWRMFQHDKSAGSGPTPQSNIFHC